VSSNDFTGHDQALQAAAAALLDRRAANGSERHADLLADADGIQIQQCLDCGYLRYPAARHCPECLSDRADWQRDPGTGTVYASAVYHRSFHPAFQDAVPYVVALIQLNSGPQVFSAVLGVDSAVPAGTAMRAATREVSPGKFVAYFEPSTGGTR
jgi:uncharacterized OB-fold protein